MRVEELPIHATRSPFLKGNSPISPEIAVTEAKKCGLIQNRSQVLADCRTALSQVIHPMRRSRLLRLIVDLGLTQLVPDIQLLLQAPTADERSGSARALGRLGADSAIEALTLLLQDPVQDVRKAAWNALQMLQEKDSTALQSPSSSRPAPRKSADGTRSWVIESTGTTDQSDDQQDWKARLRKMLDS